MNRFKFDYRSYRGRASVTDWLKRIALILSILVAIGISILYFAPDFFTSPSSPSTTDTSSSDLSSDPEGSVHSNTSASSQSTPDDVVSPSEQPEETPLLKAVYVPLDSIVDGSAAQLAQQANANGVVVTMKDDTGKLNWTTNQVLGEPFQEGSSDPSTDAIKQWNQGDLYTIAQFSCFRDDIVGRKMDYTLYTVSDFRWMDDEDYHWSTPESDAVQDYYISLMVELAQLGFDEILLEHCGFPSQQDGSLNNIQYPAQEKEALITQFLDKAAQALKPYETTLSIHTDYEILQVGSDETGLTASALFGTVSHLLVPEEQMQQIEALLNVQNVTTSPSLTALCTAFSESASYNQVVFPS